MVDTRRIARVRIPRDVTIGAGGPTGPEYTGFKDRVDPGSSGTEGELLAWRTGAPAYIPHRSPTGIMVAAAESSQEAKDQADFHPDTAGSDSDHLQSAIDEAQTYVSGSTAAAPVVLLPGAHRWDGPVTMKSAPIAGESTMNVGVRVYWDGTNAETALTKSSLFAGGGSFGRLANISFRAGTSEPDTWLDLPGLIDAGMRLEELHFSGGRVQIHMGAPLNTHWAHLRFDGWGDYAIVCDDQAYTQGSIHLRDFTADNFRSDVAPAKGFIHFDNTVNLTNWGVFHLQDGRIELNQAWDGAGPTTLFELTTEQPRFLNLHLQDMTIVDSSAQAASYLFHSTSVSTTISHRYLLENLTIDGITKIFGGTLGTAMAELPVQPHYPLALVGAGMAPVFSALALHPPATAAVKAISMRRHGESQDRWYVNNDGEMWMGSGAAVGDVRLYRSGAATYRINPNLAVTTNVTIGGALDHDGTTVGLFGKTPVTQPAANPDTSGATLITLETEVNELKAALRALGAIAT